VLAECPGGGGAEQRSPRGKRKDRLADEQQDRRHDHDDSNGDASHVSVIDALARSLQRCGRMS